MLDIEPWEKQIEETYKAFAAFQIYRDLGPTRTVARVAEMLHGPMKSANDPRRHLGKWCADNKWKSRAMAWDAHIDRMLCLDKIEAIKKMNEEHSQMARGFIGIVARKMEVLKDAKINPHNMISMFEKAAKIERLARGEATEIQKNINTNIEDEPIDLSALTNDEIDVLAKLHSKAKRLQQPAERAGEEAQGTTDPVCD